MKAGYFNPFSGASGDMVLGALLDAGAPLEEIRQELQGLPLTGYEIKVAQVRRGVVQGSLAEVVVSLPHPALHSLGQIIGLLEVSSLPAAVKSSALAIFRRLGQAEGRVHGVAPEQVAFHEVGAVDAVVEVVASLLGLKLLGVERVFCAPFHTGGGRVHTEHGVLPVPPPGVMELLALSRAPFQPGSAEDGELLTPTGAAILTTLASFEHPLLSPERTGYGAGSRDVPRWPNVLPFCLGELSGELAERELLLLETNIDDMTPQTLGYVMDLLLEQGALDVWFTPIQMKKNRPAVLLSALFPPAAEAALVATVLRETTTLGLRLTSVRRIEAEREVVEVASTLGRVRVKLKKIGDQVVGLTPEYEDCRRLAREHRLPLGAVLQKVAEEARRGLDLR